MSIWRLHSYNTPPPPASAPYPQLLYDGQREQDQQEPVCLQYPEKLQSKQSKMCNMHNAGILSQETTDCMLVINHKGYNTVRKYLIT